MVEVKKKVNGKAKGNQFERDVARIFSQRFERHFGVKRAFLRNSDSGAYFGGKNAHRADDSVSEHIKVSDVLSPSEFRFVIECKFYQSAPSLGSFLSGYGKFDEWLPKLFEDVDTLNVSHGVCNYLPLLVCKWNRVPAMAVFPYGLFGEWSGLYLTDVVVGRNVHHLVYRDIRGSLWCGVLLDVFLSDFVVDSFYMV